MFWVHAAIFQLVLGTPPLCADIAPDAMYRHVYMLQIAAICRDLPTYAGVVLRGRVGVVVGYGYT